VRKWSVQVSGAPKGSAAPASTTVETASAAATRNTRAVRMGKQGVKAKRSISAQPGQIVLA
jgi:hypothetical protein